MDLSSRSLHALPGVPARPEIVRRIAMTGCPAAGVAAASHRRILHRGVAREALMFRTPTAGIHHWRNRT